MSVPTRCEYCHRDPAPGFAFLGNGRYCHEGESPTCYELAQMPVDEGLPDEWNGTEPIPTVGDVWCVPVYRNHRSVGPAYFRDKADAIAFHAFVNGERP